MSVKSHTEFMNIALQLAEKGRGYVEPNPLVGAVIVKNGQIIGRGYHTRYGRPHAEAEAIKNARENGFDTQNADIYVTLEPCSHHGKTPPCTEAIIRAGIKKVFIAAEDPLWKVHATSAPEKKTRGIDVLTSAGIQVSLGDGENAAVIQNAAFYKSVKEKCPVVTAKWAMTLDGKIATKSGHSQWISSKKSRKRVHEIRGMVDAVIVGSRTAVMDDAMLTCRDAECKRVPDRVVICGNSIPQPDSRLVKTADSVPVILAYPEGNPPKGINKLKKLGCALLPVKPLENHENSVDLAMLLRLLGQRQAHNVLVEGGGQTLGGFADAGLIDKTLVFIAGKIAGGEAAVTPVGGTGVEKMDSAIKLLGERTSDSQSIPTSEPVSTLEILGNDIKIEGWVKDPRQWYK